MASFQRVSSRLLLFSLSVLAAAVPSAWAEDRSSSPRITLVGNQDASHQSVLRPDSLAVVSVDNLDETKLAAFAARNPSFDQWSTLFAVFVLSDSGTLRDDQPALIGRYQATGKTLRFTPKYPLAEGLRLRARLNPSVLDGRAGNAPGSGIELAGLITQDLRIDGPGTSSTRPVLERAVILGVWPANIILPENLLRFYIQFSVPMARGEAYRHLQLLDDLGKPVADPFLEIDEELWSRDGCRFTLLFDPGRIKRGLKPREEVGPILQEGRSYTLVVGKDWPDATGKPLVTGLRRSFHVGPPDTTPPDPATWKLTIPKDGSLDPLVVRFPDPLDRPLALRLISIAGPDGQAVDGKPVLDESQKTWRFAPVAAWKSGEEYKLIIGTDLEDLAGNAVGRPFEVDMTAPITSRVVAEKVTLPFRIGAAAR